MARVINPLGGTAASGKLGGLVFRTTSGVSTVKQFTGVKRGHTAREAVVMAAAADCARRWKTLPRGYRERWNNHALNHNYESRWGAPHRISGFNWFVALGVLVGISNLPQLQDPPSYQLDAQIYSVLLWIEDQLIYIDWEYTGNPPLDQTYAEVYYFGPHKPSRNPNLKDARRYDSSPIGEPTAFDATGRPGYWSFWVRLFHAQGTHTGWCSSKIYLPPNGGAS